MYDSLKAKILSGVETKSFPNVVSDLTFGNDKKNELVFFFKPECFIHEKPEFILDVAFKRFEKFDIEITGAVIYDGNSLKQRRIMNRHYGYINELSENASHKLSKADETKVRSTVDGFDATILGGDEFIEKYPEYSPKQLDKLWLTKESIKLRSGFYYQKYFAEGEDIILVNGFNPIQLEHFTNPKHRLVLLLLKSDLSWKSLKEDFVGDTYPEHAVVDSIRGDLYANQDKYGLEGVRISKNFVHLSAGPFEAAFEMWNFFQSSIDDFNVLDCNLFSRMLELNIDQNKIVRSLENPFITIDGKTSDLFSYTEFKDTDEAIQLYHQHYS